MYNHVYNHACNYVTIDYQQIVYGNIANQIHGMTVNYRKFILKSNIRASFARVVLRYKKLFPAFL